MHAFSWASQGPIRDAHVAFQRNATITRNKAASGVASVDCQIWSAISWKRSRADQRRSRSCDTNLRHQESFRVPLSDPKQNKGIQEYWNERFNRRYHEGSGVLVAVFAQTVFVLGGRASYQNVIELENKEADGFNSEVFRPRSKPPINLLESKQLALQYERPRHHFPDLQLTRIRSVTKFPCLI